MFDNLTTKSSPRYAVDFLLSLEKFGIKMDLENISALMNFAGRPHEKLRMIHVAGTNGKGSTCAMLASILTEQDYAVGLYTSPHIIDFTERIKIGGRAISLEDVAALTEFFQPEIVRLKATFFEATTAIMFKYFADRGVDYAVIETGLGGRLDATNIISPIVSVITSIGLDHTELLGDSREKIAFEKAGIIKKGIPAIVNVDDEPVKDVFRKAGRERGAAVTFVGEAARATGIATGLGNSVFDANISGKDYAKLEVGLGGDHQVSNALTALCAVQSIRDSGIPVGDEAVYGGLKDVAANTNHRGRLEVVSQKPLIILDVAHNPDGIRALDGALGLITGRKGVLLFAAMRDKDAMTMLSTLRGRFEQVILTQLQSGRSLNREELKKLSVDIKLTSQVFGSSVEALRAALNQLDDDRFLLIAGSHYLAGEVLPILEKTPLNI